jgi:hypothetical protein
MLEDIADENVQQGGNLIEGITGRCLWEGTESLSCLENRFFQFVLNLGQPVGLSKNEGREKLLAY